MKRIAVAAIISIGLSAGDASSQSMPVMTQHQGMAAGYSWTATGGMPLVAGRPRTRAFCFFGHASVIYFDGKFYAANGLARGRVNRATIRYQGRNHDLLDEPPDAALAGLTGPFVPAANRACNP